jgi:hypothetical protein
VLDGDGVGEGGVGVGDGSLINSIVAVWRSR